MYDGGNTIIYPSMATFIVFFCDTVVRTAASRRCGTDFAAVMVRLQRFAIDTAFAVLMAEKEYLRVLIVDCPIAQVQRAEYG